jgi:hypothetical protein
MSAPIIPTLPDAPLPDDSQSQHDAKAYPFVAALNPFGEAVNEFAYWLQFEYNPILNAVTTGIEDQSIAGIKRFDSYSTHAKIVINRTTPYEDYASSVNGKSFYWGNLVANGGSGFTNEGAVAKFYTNEQGAVVRSTNSAATIAQLNFINKIVSGIHAS